jgi:phosphoserine phosphatase RsbU/P
MQGGTAYATHQSPRPKNSRGAAPPPISTTWSALAPRTRQRGGDRHPLWRQEKQVLIEALAAQEEQLERMQVQLQAARDIIAEYDQVQRDLALARQMQCQMLPDAFPDVPGLIVAATTQPARGIGGDFYDVVRLDTHRVGLLVGDVAGKGIPAALEMARLQGDFRACVRASAEPQGVMQTLNRWLCQRHTRVSTFVTVQYVVLDLAAHRLHFICAGHPPLLRRRADGRVEPLGAAPNIPLGIEAQFPYHQETCACAPGETLLLYSDGVYERQNAPGERLGLPRLQAWFSTAPPDPTALIQTLQAVLATFGDAGPLQDDTTLLCAHLGADRPPKWNGLQSQSAETAMIAVSRPHAMHLSPRGIAS